METYFKKTSAGQKILQTDAQTVEGEIVTIADEKYYKISNYDLMPPFFMNIVSDSDLWMFISSNGALTAGRRNPDNALFPYYPDDQIQDLSETTGSKTIVRILKDGQAWLWEPFSSRYQGLYLTARNIYKNMAGNQVIFEEVNHDLKVRFQYGWFNCDRFGFVRKATITNHDAEPITVSIIDGIQNILPAGLNRRFQADFSTLGDGYKRNELLTGLALGLFTLSSIPTDTAEPSESLKATTVWSAGLPNATVLLSGLQLDPFRHGRRVVQETDIRAERGAYLLHSEFGLQPGRNSEWYMAADLNQDHSDVAALSDVLKNTDNLPKLLEDEINQSTTNLKIFVGEADGLQQTRDPLVVFRHFSNTLFNIMRGGIFENNYVMNKDDFRAFVRNANRPVSEKYASFINGLPGKFNHYELMHRLTSPDPDFERLCREYLPLTFSRRHGDPSRPWNHFSIDIRDDQGNKKLNYQGNWRDIFQNWEALALAFPEFIEGMIAKFVNSSTADGYNPFRVTRDGFDWDVLDPEDPRAYVGYWGDHQIIYLLKLLELSVKYHPGRLQSMLERNIFAYANVPYKIKPYEDLVRDPHHTIEFDFKLHAEIERKVKSTGTDGKFVQDENRKVYHVNLAEKLLVPLLVKLSNFIPEAGIWMNTQRPEWNDANNALVGYGASMVTVYYLRRYIVFCLELFQNTPSNSIEISEEVAGLFTEIHTILGSFRNLLKAQISDEDRKKITDRLGRAGSHHRRKIYSSGFSGIRNPVSIHDLRSFLRTSLDYIDHSIKANRRDDDLYHAYNLIKFTRRNEISIRHLYEMLEGQVAVLHSGFLHWEDTIMLLSALKKSALYRKDQSSYLLYPNRQLPRFLKKNHIPAEKVAGSPLLQSLVQKEDRSIIIRDMNGDYHFNSNLHNGRFLRDALQSLSRDGTPADDADLQYVLDLYESVFDHQSFTGRSGTFYKYEGLGCIYWHMVSKLLHAVQDTFYRAMEAQVNPSILEKLKHHYYEIREGIGIHKNPSLYGAFPTDPYSHTPQNRGAQQPGMTGQAKEDVISRFGELGVEVMNGKIRFNPALLNKEEFLAKSRVYSFYDINRRRQTLMLNPGMLAFTVCQVPVVYIRADHQSIVVTHHDGTEETIEALELSELLSTSIFRREGKISKINVLMNIKTG